MRELEALSKLLVFLIKDKDAPISIPVK